MSYLESFETTCGLRGSPPILDEEDYGGARNEVFCRNRGITRESAYSLLSSLRRVAAVDLSYNAIDGFPQYLPPFVTALNLSNNNLYSTLELEAAINLRELNLSGNALRNAEGLYLATNLEYLDLSYNKITTLDGLETLSKLKVLLLQGNSVSNPAAVRALSFLRKLQYLDIEGNPISRDLRQLRPQITNMVPNLLVLNGMHLKSRRPLNIGSLQREMRYSELQPGLESSSASAVHSQTMSRSNSFLPTDVGVSLGRSYSSVGPSFVASAVPSPSSAGCRTPLLPVEAAALNSRSRSTSPMNSRSGRFFSNNRMRGLEPEYSSGQPDLNLPNQPSTTATSPDAWASSREQEGFDDDRYISRDEFDSPAGESDVESLQTGRRQSRLPWRKLPNPIPRSRSGRPMFTTSPPRLFSRRYGRNGRDSGENKHSDNIKNGEDSGGSGRDDETVSAGFDQAVPGAGTGSNGRPRSASNKRSNISRDQSLSEATGSADRNLNNLNSVFRQTPQERHQQQQRSIPRSGADPTQFVYVINEDPGASFNHPPDEGEAVISLSAQQRAFPPPPRYIGRSAATTAAVAAVVQPPAGSQQQRRSSSGPGDPGNRREDLPSSIGMRDAKGEWEGSSPSCSTVDILAYGLDDDLSDLAVEDKRSDADKSHSSSNNINNNNPMSDHVNCRDPVIGDSGAELPRTRAAASPVQPGSQPSGRNRVPSPPPPPPPVPMEPTRSLSRRSSRGGLSAAELAIIATSGVDGERDRLRAASGLSSWKQPADSDPHPGADAASSAPGESSALSLHTPAQFPDTRISGSAEGIGAAGDCISASSSRVAAGSNSSNGNAIPRPRSIHSEYGPRTAGSLRPPASYVEMFDNDLSRGNSPLKSHTAHRGVFHHTTGNLKSIYYDALPKNGAGMSARETGNHSRSTSPVGRAGTRNHGRFGSILSAKLLEVEAQQNTQPQNAFHPAEQHNQLQPVDRPLQQAPALALGFGLGPPLASETASVADSEVVAGSVRSSRQHNVGRPRSRSPAGVHTLASALRASFISESLVPVKEREARHDRLMLRLMHNTEIERGRGSGVGSGNGRGSEIVRGRSKSRSPEADRLRGKKYIPKADQSTNVGVVGASRRSLGERILAEYGKSQPFHGRGGNPASSMHGKSVEDKGDTESQSHSPESPYPDTRSRSRSRSPYARLLQMKERISQKADALAMSVPVLGDPSNQSNEEDDGDDGFVHEDDINGHSRKRSDRTSSKFSEEHGTYRRAESRRQFMREEEEEEVMRRQISRSNSHGEMDVEEDLLSLVSESESGRARQLERLGQRARDSLHSHGYDAATATAALPPSTHRHVHGRGLRPGSGQVVGRGGYGNGSEDSSVSVSEESLGGRSRQSGHDIFFGLVQRRKEVMDKLARQEAYRVNEIKKALIGKRMERDIFSLAASSSPPMPGMDRRQSAISLYHTSSKTESTLHAQSLLSTVPVAYSPDPKVGEGNADRVAGSSEMESGSISAMIRELSSRKISSISMIEETTSRRL